jgi:glycosyltransferase involved in cell wall biosynthesis
MSIFAGADASELRQSISSIWEGQSLRPSEVVLVLDGPVPPTLSAVVDAKARQMGTALKIVNLRSNQGLGEALRVGVMSCNYEWIARMDADDISRPDRFEKQCAAVKSNPSIDIVGGFVQELTEDKLKHYQLRRCPNSHQEIISYAKKRCPFNHPTVIFRKKAVLEAGNYRPYRKYQDYELWVRLIQSGAKCLNISCPLVDMKMDKAMVERRGGLKYALIEYSIQSSFFKSGFISRWEFLRNVCMRGTVRLIPSFARYWIYRTFLR